MKRDDKKKKSTSFAFTVSKNYLIFTCAVLVALGMVYLWSVWQMNQAFPFVREDSLLKKLEQAEGKQDFARIDVTKYLGEGSQIVIYNEKDEIIYSSKQDIPQDYFVGKLGFIGGYDEDSYVSVNDFVDEDGRQCYLLKKEIFSSGGSDMTKQYVLLDQDFQELSGTFPGEKISFSKEEGQAFVATEQGTIFLEKQAFVGKDGRQYVVLMTETGRFKSDYRVSLELWNYSWIIFVVMYILLMFVSVQLLSRKTKHLLKPLNQALLELAQGKHSHLNQYEGPQEFEEIASSFEQLSDELSKSEAKRRKVEESKQKLLADISHDLKTPVTVISGYAGALKDGMVPKEKEQEYLEGIYNRTEKMKELILAFHEYSMLKHPDFPIQMERINLCSAVQVYFADKYSEIELAEMDLKAEIPDQAIWCLIDLKLFTRALDNLVNNSIRYGGAGTTISVMVEQRKSKAYLWIGDNGTGILKEQQENIFEPFVIGDPSRGKKHGSGLGLSISQKLIDAHGGKIRIAPEFHGDNKIEFEIMFPVIE